MRCQTFFQARARKVPDMVDLTLPETAAIEAALAAVANKLDAIGWQTPPSAWSKTQLLGLIRASVEGFQDAMRQAAALDPMDCPF